MRSLGSFLTERCIRCKFKSVFYTQCCPLCSSRPLVAPCKALLDCRSSCPAFPLCVQISLLSLTTGLDPRTKILCLTSLSFGTTQGPHGGTVSFKIPPEDFGPPGWALLLGANIGSGALPSWPGLATRRFQSRRFPYAPCLAKTQVPLRVG